MRRDVSAVLLITALTLGCAGEGTSPEAAASVEVAEVQSLSVYAVNYPLQYFAQRIGGARVEAVLPAPADEDPAYWSPAPEEVVAFQGADLILLNGAGYAKWVGRVTLPETKLVDTSAGLQGRLIPLQEGPVHTHGPEGEHSHTGYAFTTWLDPALAVEHARAVLDALAQAGPANAEAFEVAFAALEADLNGVGQRWDAVAAALAGQPVLFSHPVYQYPIRRWELDAESLHWEPDEAPDEQQWTELQEVLDRRPAEWMIWEAEPLPETADRLRTLGVESLVLRPNATAPDEGDLIRAWTSDLDAIETALLGAS